jgi:hypothetical protein
MEPLMPNWRAISERLYTPLKSSPCRCQMRWEKAELTVVVECSRCQAIALFESLREVAA